MINPHQVNAQRAEQMTREARILKEWMSRFPVENDGQGSPYNDREKLQKCIYLASKSTKLDLAKMGLVDPLPVDAYTIMYVKQVLLNDNHLINISPLMGNPRMGGIIQLNLANNLLTSLPEEIGELHELVFLTLHKNHLRSAPAVRWALLCFSSRSSVLARVSLRQPLFSPAAREPPVFGAQAWPQLTQMRTPLSAPLSLTHKERKQTHARTHARTDACIHARMHGCTDARTRTRMRAPAHASAHTGPGQSTSDQICANV